MQYVYDNSLESENNFVNQPNNQSFINTISIDAIQKHKHFSAIKDFLTKTLLGRTILITVIIVFLVITGLSLYSMYSFTTMKWMHFAVLLSLIVSSILLMYFL